MGDHRGYMVLAGQDRQVGQHAAGLGHQAAEAGQDWAQLGAQGVDHQNRPDRRLTNIVGDSPDPNSTSGPDPAPGTGGVGLSSTSYEPPHRTRSSRGPDRNGSTVVPQAEADR